LVFKKDTDFEQVCWLAGFDPDHINYQYKKCLKEKVIYFTSVQLYWIDYKEAYKDYREAEDKEQRASVELELQQFVKNLKYRLRYLKSM
jgi:hypothetical protein